MLPIGAQKVQLLAEQQREGRIVAGEIEVCDAAPDPDRPHRRLDRHPALVLAELAADKPGNALAEGGDQFSGARVRIIDEFIDDKIGIGADGEGRSVNQQHLNQSARAGFDALVVNHVVAKNLGGSVSTRRRSEGGAVDRRGNANFDSGSGHRRHPQDGGRQKHPDATEPAATRYGTGDFSHGNLPLLKIF